MRTFRPSLLLPVLALTLGLAGCDEAGSNTFETAVTGLRFTFSVDGGDLNDGTTVVSENTANIIAELPAGFSAADVQSVRLRDGDAQIRLLNSPAGEDIGVLETASFAIGSAGNAVTVASQDDFASMTGSMASEAQLDVNGADAASAVTGGAFSGFLDLDGSGADASAIYRFEVRFDVTVALNSL